jgi:DNA modification methylase
MRLTRANRRMAKGLGDRIVHCPVDALRPYPRNPRTHSRKQIRQIADSIQEFGFCNPVLVDDNDQIIAGHGRVEAAKRLGMETVPTVRLSHLTEAQKRAYIIADNRLAELAHWDREILAIELQNLTAEDLDFDIEVVGFETGEIDVLIEELGDGDKLDDEADLIPPVDDKGPAVTRPGDLWTLGEHRLLCGDATKAEDCGYLLGRRKAQMVFTDPPYNVPIDDHVCGLGSVRHDDFAMAAGEMSETEFIRFLETVLGHMAAVSADGSLHFICMDWRHLFELLTAGRAVYSDFKNVCVWNKTNGGMGSLYRSKHELVLVFKKGAAPHINNVSLGRNGRYRSNVWDYPGINALGRGREARLAMHPTVKPVALVADAIKDCSKRRGRILDPFAGSGTTLIAAERTGRRCAAMELEPRYVDVTIRRWQAVTGGEAVHAVTGTPFSDLAEARTRKDPQTRPRLTFLTVEREAPHQEGHDHGQ